MNAHASHPDIVKRLKKAEGHLRGIVTMLEEGRGCLEVAQQLQAVEKAIAKSPACVSPALSAKMSMPAPSRSTKCGMW